MSSGVAPLHVTAVAAAAQLGGTERVLLDFAARAFEYDIALRVLTPRRGPLVEILNEIGVPTQVVPGPTAMMRGSQRAGGLSSLPAAVGGLAVWARRLRRHSFLENLDVLLAVAFKPYLATARFKQAPTVWHLHEYPPALTGKFWLSLSRRVPSAMIANSDAVARAWGGPMVQRSDAPTVTTVPNGVDLDRFRPRERSYWIHDQLGIPREDRLIGMPAVLARWKGQLEVIDAFSLIAAQFPETHIVFVGGSIYDTVAERRYREELSREIAKWRTAQGQRIHQLPFQEKVELVYPELDFAIHYSTRPEPFGRVVLEAMACGTPVVAAAEGGPLEIITEGGWLVEPRRSDSLAAALVSALQMGAVDLKKIGEHGRIRAEDRFSARRFAKGVAGVLWDAAGRTDGKGVRR